MQNLPRAAAQELEVGLTLTAASDRESEREREREGERSTHKRVGKQELELLRSKWSTKLQ